MVNTIRAVFCSLAVLIAVGCESDPVTSPDTSETILDQYVFPGAAVFPEGVATVEASRTYFVGSTADGTIFRGRFADSIPTVLSPGGSDQRSTVVGIKVDGKGRLFAAGGASGMVYVYDTSGTFLARLSRGVEVEDDTSFINDLAVSPSGAVYATDSRDSVLYRIIENGSQFQMEPWLSFAGTPLVYSQGFNLNGIVATSDGKYLLTVQSNRGKLYRITIADKSITEIAVTGDSLTNGDGLLLEGQTLYVVRNQNGQIVKLNMTADFSSATEVSRTTNASFNFPTTIASAGNRLMVVNGQLNKRQTGTQTLPFTLSTIPKP
jgi:sugar lactone lactonase YvrE